MHIRTPPLRSAVKWQLICAIKNFPRLNIGILQAFIVTDEELVMVTGVDNTVNDISSGNNSANISTNINMDVK